MHYEPPIPGLIPSPRDDRDFAFSAVAGTEPLPSSFFSDISRIPVVNQGSNPSCSGQAGAFMQEYYELKDEGILHDLSPRFLYAKAKEIDGYNGEGTSLRVVLKILQDYGVCRNQFFPEEPFLSNATYKDWTKITSMAYADAAQARIKSYARVNTDPESIKRAIVENGLVMLAYYGNNESWRADPIVPSGADVWGHAVTAYGYDDFLWFRNWWSPLWGRHGGNGKISFDYPIIEAWTLVDIPGDILEELKSMARLVIKDGEQYLRASNNLDTHIYNEETLHKLYEAGIIPSLSAEPVDTINDSGKDWVCLTKK